MSLFKATGKQCLLKVQCLQTWRPSLVKRRKLFVVMDMTSNHQSEQSLTWLLRSTLMEILPVYLLTCCTEVCVTKLKVYLLFWCFHQYTERPCTPCSEQRVLFLIVNTLSTCSFVSAIKLLGACVCARSPVLGDTTLGLLTPLPSAWAANN